MKKLMFAAALCVAFVIAGCSGHEHETMADHSQAEATAAQAGGNQAERDVAPTVTRSGPAATANPVAPHTPFPAPAKNNDSEGKNGKENVAANTTDAITEGSDREPAADHHSLGNNSDPAPQSPVSATAPESPAPATPEPTPVPMPKPTPEPMPEPIPESKQDIAVCNTCGQEMTLDDIVAHGKSHTLNGENFSYYVK